MRGACPPSPAPPASGKVPVPGRGRCRAKTRSVGGGKKSRNNVKLSSRFSAEKQLHVFAPTCRLQSIDGGVRACRKYMRGWGGLVREETRRRSPLSLPRTPLFCAERYTGIGCIFSSCFCGISPGLRQISGAVRVDEYADTGTNTVSWLLPSRRLDIIPYYSVTSNYDAEMSVCQESDRKILQKICSRAERSGDGA